MALRMRYVRTRDRHHRDRAAAFEDPAVTTHGAMLVEKGVHLIENLISRTSREMVCAKASSSLCH